jgi:hypothetical protein
VGAPYFLEDNKMKNVIFVAGLCLVVSGGVSAQAADQFRVADPSKQYKIDRVKQFDSDNNGTVSEKEFFKLCTAGVKANFVKADKNGNKELSQVEMRTAKAYLFKGCEALADGDKPVTSEQMQPPAKDDLYRK